MVPALHRSGSYICAHLVVKKFLPHEEMNHLGTEGQLFPPRDNHWAHVYGAAIWNDLSKMLAIKLKGAKTGK